MSLNQVFKFWSAVEALSPQEAARTNPRDPDFPVYSVTRAEGSSLPWEDPSHLTKQVMRGKAWAYTAQCGLHDSMALSMAVTKCLGETIEETDVRPQAARLFDLAFDRQGFPIASTFNLSLAAWSAGCILRSGGDLDSLMRGGARPLLGLPAPSEAVPEVNSGFEGYDRLARALTQWVINAANELREENTPVNSTWILTVCELVGSHIGVGAEMLDQHELCRVRCLQVKATGSEAPQPMPAASEQQEILASFYVEDLQRLQAASRIGNIGKALSLFMGVHHDEDRRIDVRDPASEPILEGVLNPEMMPAGRWPSDHPLVFSQQLAVNQIWGDLKSSAGLFAVNGPPGTGKTTLLRDLIAAVVTERAARLVRLGGRAFGAKETTRIAGAVIPHFSLHHTLCDFSIVVSTANNGAAKNVSAEIPGVAAVPSRIPSKSAYFPEIASQVIQKDAWGLLAAPLGNRRNRAEFMSAFWWAKADMTTGAGAGLRDHLKGIQLRQQSASMSWEASVAAYHRAVSHEAEMRHSVGLMATRPGRVAALASEQAKKRGDLDDLMARLEGQRLVLQELSLAMTRHCGSSLKTMNEMERGQQERAAHQQVKPGVLDWISTLGKSHKIWWQRAAAIQSQIERIQSDLLAQDAKRQDLDQKNKSALASIEVLNKRVRDLQVALVSLQCEVRVEEENLARDDLALRGARIHEGMDLEDREHLTPWAESSWLQAREHLFLAALDVHRAFIEAHPTEFMANLGLASDWLSGKRLPESLAKLALDSLCMVVPVLSTTFASVARMFADIGRESIGWLLVDEAGQAQPGHAAGAIWRASRVVMVGDPLQLEPVVTVPRSLESKLSDWIGVSGDMSPSSTSAQQMADRSSILGTYIPSVDGGETWVGCPLRLHRRCASPMFEISNAVAYDGLMVHSKHPRVIEAPDSCWIDVQAPHSMGHWVEEEGVALKSLLAQLVDDAGVPADQIALISPFRDAAVQLRRIAKQFGLDSGLVGTIHTAQGKEADIVVIVLGGNPQVPGAKAWASAKPNVLNVAVSRAKERLYVIGDRGTWSSFNYFDTLSANLPEERAVA